MAHRENQTGLKSLSIKELVADKVLSSKVYTLMEQQKSYSYIQQFLATKGYKMAKGSLTNLKNKLKESQEQGISMQELADKREKDSIDDIPDDKIEGFTGKQEVATNNTQTAMPIYSEDQILEQIMQKGARTIAESDYVDEKTLMTAIHLHAQYFGSKTGGLTSEALKQYQLVMQARIQAISEVFIRYVPKDKQKEAFAEMEKRSKQILNQLGATKEGKELLKQLRKANVPLD